VVRESYKKLFDLCISAVDEDGEASSNWLSLLDSTSWLSHISRILVGSKRIAEAVDDRTDCIPVLVHCSDGWDRTSQLSSLAQLMLDPHYRTLQGFQTLLCKEWLSFGHQFAVRAGHNYGGKEDPEQEAPIFVQFLDCVHQLIVQFPTSFQFTEDLLLCCHDEMLHCRFGTFLMNCEREREEERLAHRTRSFWEYLETNEASFMNPFYHPPKTSSLTPLIPRCNIPHLTFWSAYFHRHLDSSPTPSSVLMSHMRSQFSS
jgi:hypothetical protein